MNIKNMLLAGGLLFVSNNVFSAVVGDTYGAWMSGDQIVKIARVLPEHADTSVEGIDISMTVPTPRDGHTKYSRELFASAGSVIMSSTTSVRPLGIGIVTASSQENSKRISEMLNKKADAINRSKQVDSASVSAREQLNKEIANAIAEGRPYRV